MPCQSSHEPNLIATVIQLFVIDRPLTCAIRCTLNEKDGTANAYAQCPHIFDEAGQLSEFLRNLGLRDKGAFTTPNLNQSPPYQVLNCLPNSGTAYCEAFYQEVFGWQRTAWGE